MYRPLWRNFSRKDSIWASRHSLLNFFSYPLLRFSSPSSPRLIRTGSYVARLEFDSMPRCTLKGTVDSELTAISAKGFCACLASVLDGAAQ
ncbi:hypothetical protein GOBAR_DD07783 [Gossypium barbadense]|nr:hypothetical protein GOBAR_DD07783 [Gossypium barbadense]